MHEFRGKVIPSNIMITGGKFGPVVFFIHTDYAWSVSLCGFVCRSLGVCMLAYLHLVF